MQGKGGEIKRGKGRWLMMDEGTEEVGEKEAV